MVPEIGNMGSPELQAAVRYQMWVLGIELGPSVRIASFLKR